MVFGILVPSGIKPGAPTVRLDCPNYWTAREFPIILLFQSDLCLKPISQRRFPWLSYLQSHLPHSDAVYLSCFIYFKALADVYLFTCLLYIFSNWDINSMGAEAVSIL